MSDVGYDHDRGQACSHDRGVKCARAFAGLLDGKDGQLGCAPQWENAPAVVTLRQMDKHLESVASIQVVVRSPEREANRRFEDALVQALRALPGDDATIEVERTTAESGAP